MILEPYSLKTPVGLMTLLMVSFPWYLSKHWNQYHFPEYILSGKILPPASVLPEATQEFHEQSGAGVLPWVMQTFEKATPLAHTYSKALVYCLVCSRIPNRNIHIVNCQLKDLLCKLIPYRQFAAQRLAPATFLCWAHYVVTSHSSRSGAKLVEVWTKGQKNQTSDNIKGEEQANQM